MTVSEQRTVEFDSAAILQAFSVVRRVSEALGLQCDKIARVTFEPDRQAISVIAESGLPVAELRAETLAALLIAYCSRIKIPLPRPAEKNVEITSHSAVLRITSESRPDRPRNGLRADFPGAMVWNKSKSSY
jgi:hypothetical protein